MQTKLSAIRNQKKQTSSNNASHRTINRLINEIEDKPPVISLNNVTAGSQRLAQWHKTLITFHAPNPKGGSNIIESDQCQIPYQHPHCDTNASKNAPNFIEDEAPAPRRSQRNRFPQFQRPVSPTGTSNEALFAVISGDMGKPKDWVVKDVKNNYEAKEIIDLQEFYGGVTLPVTGGIITSYRKLMKIPELMEVWSKALCIELGNISQLWGNKEQFLDHAEIAIIPKNKVVTYM